MDDSSMQNSTILSDTNETSSTRQTSSKTKRSSKTKKSNIKNNQESDTTRKKKKNAQTSQAVVQDVVPKKSKNVTTPNEKNHSLNVPTTVATSFTASFSRAHQNELKKIINDCFGYTLKEIDFTFIQDLYTDLPVLNDTWDRIGFNSDTKKIRLEKFYSDITERFQGLIESEQELEENIREEIEKHRVKIKQLCFDLQIRNNEDPKNKSNSSKAISIMEEENHLRKEVKRLDAEKTKRLDSYKKLAEIEEVLCTKLKMSVTQMIKSIPSENDINALSTRIKEMEKEKIERLNKMTEYKNKIIEYSNDLELSRSDSFAEQIIFESPETMSLGIEDLERANEFLEDLMCKYNEAQDEIKSLRVKIKELWDKLKIDNLNLKEIVINNNINSASKRTLCIELRKEYDRCVKIKMENMQKYIENVREEIKQFCIKMFIGTKELQAFEMLKSTNFNEDLLKEHEDKLEDLKFKFQEFESLYEKCAKWIEMWTNFVEFEEKTKDPMRLKQRGYNMLNEEKERKTYNTVLPKLEEELKKLASEYQEINGGQVFKIFNDPYDDYIYKKRLDHEDTKQNQRKEKQILRETVKKNETRYGSKPATPLALQRLKRKQQETLLQSPGSKSKLQRTDLSIASNTPGASRLLLNKQSTAKTSAHGLGLSAKSKTAISKRKSKTPSKAKLLRRSRQLAAAAAAQINDIDATILSSDTTTKTTSLMSTIMSNTNASSCSTNASSVNGSKSRNNTAASSKSNNAKKFPPQCNSSKFASAHGINNDNTSSRFGLHRMTSTASNTFIEEENIDDIENYPSDSILANNKHTLLFNAASAKLANADFNFQAPLCSTTNGMGSKINGGDINYLEFTRELGKQQKFGSNSNLSDSKNKSQQASTKTNTLRESNITRGTLAATRSSKYN